MNNPEIEPSAAEQQARELESILDAAADDLERNGSIPPDQVRGALLALYAELGEQTAAE